MKKRFAIPEFPSQEEVDKLVVVVEEDKAEEEVEK